MDRTKLLSLITTLSKQRSGFVPDRPLGKGKDRTWRESKRHKSQMSRSHRRRK